MLIKVLVGISYDMKYNSIKLIFYLLCGDGRYRKEDGIMVILDLVCDIKVINWWSLFYFYYEEVL